MDEIIQKSSTFDDVINLITTVQQVMVVPRTSETGNKRLTLIMNVVCR
jgi:hypothetical protein